MKSITIIGGGIVGLATATKLLEHNPDLRINILEKEAEVAVHQTGNNSGVIHSGIYYKPGSLKALNCKKGYDMLLKFCGEHQIPHEITGKIIAATRPEELPLLDNIFKRGVENGLQGLKKINAREASEIEPHVKCLAAVWVPQAGIIHYALVAQKHKERLLAKGVTLTHNAKVLAIRRNNDGSQTVESTAGDFSSDLCINCAGLYSDEIARMTDPSFNGQIIPFRGEYYLLKPEAEYLVKNLIYPVPNPNFPFLGVHFTRMMKGGIEAGPNAVLAFAREGYHRSQVNWPELAQILGFSGFRKVAAKYWRDGLNELYRSYSKTAFLRALQGLIPEIQGAHLAPGGAGVRAQLCMPDGSLVDDFLVLEKPGVIDVVNAPSPAATANLAVGEHIAQIALTHTHKH